MSSAALADLTGRAEYTVVEVPDSDSCVIIVRESSFLLRGGGALYERIISGVYQSSSSWEVNNGHRMIRSGDFTITHDEYFDYLKLNSTPTTPASPNVHALSCK